jgi:SAM-dependent methyltransferase
MTSAQRLWTDRAHLTGKAYADSGNLRARGDIYRWQQPPVDLAEWVLQQVEWDGVRRVLDIGCGPGSYLRRLYDRELQLVGMDLSPGMVRELREAWPPGARAGLGCAVADAQRLPLADGCVDLALATHMLYHVPDIGLAARELRRVLRPGGRLLAVTNSSAHLRELLDLADNALAALCAEGAPQRDALARRFRLEDGAEPLRSAFEHVERRDVQAELVIPEPGPVLRYLNSTRATREADLPASVSWDALLAEAERLVRARIDAEGAFRTRTHTGAFVCW